MELTGKLVNRAQLLFQSSKSFVWPLKSQIKCYHNLYPALELTVIYHNLVFNQGILALPKKVSNSAAMQATIRNLHFRETVFHLSSGCHGLQKAKFPN